MAMRSRHFAPNDDAGEGAQGDVVAEGASVVQQRAVNDDVALAEYGEVGLVATEVPRATVKDRTAKVPPENVPLLRVIAWAWWVY